MGAEIRRVFATKCRRARRGCSCHHTCLEGPHSRASAASRRMYGACTVTVNLAWRVFIEIQVRRGAIIEGNRRKFLVHANAV